MKSFLGMLLPLGACFGGALLLSGCKVVTQLSSGQDSDAKQPDDPAAVAFLKHSMDIYASMPAYSAECSFSMSNNGMASPSSSRTFSYERPNRFKVVSTSAGGFVQTAISDGKSVLEFDNMTGQSPRKELAPASISEAHSMQMRHPMFCGTLLYQFFGGVSNYDELVDAGKGAVKFGDEEKAPNGEQAHAVKFYAQQQYGHVEALIGEKTGHVYRIKYDSEPLMKMMQDPETQRKIKAAADSSLSNAKDAKTKSEAEAAIANMSAQANMKFVSEEAYSQISTPSKIDSKTFALIAPKGTTPVELNATGVGGYKPPVPVGSAAPPFSVSGLDGKAVSLASLRGHPVLLDFWATWCGPCVASLPHTQELYTKGRSAGLQVLAISNEERGTVSKFIGDNKYTFPTAVDSSGDASRAYKTDAIPTTVVIDADGKLVAYIVGGGQDVAIKKALAKAGVAID